MDPSSEPIIVPDAETWKAFEFNAREEWRKRHKKMSGRKSVRDKVMPLICESWLELRRGEVTHAGQYQITKHAWKKNRKFKRATYKKYTAEFVTLLAIAADREQLSEYDRKLLEKTTPALTRRVNQFKEALAGATAEAKGPEITSHQKVARQLAQSSKALLPSIEAALRKIS